MKPEQAGNCVQLGNRLIPAVNIQVEGVPGYLTDVDGEKRWYGVYFEVMFEDGSYWVVDHGTDGDASDLIFVNEYGRPKHDLDIPHPTSTQVMHSWESFIVLYDEKRSTIIRF